MHVRDKKLKQYPTFGGVEAKCAQFLGVPRTAEMVVGSEQDLNSISSTTITHSNTHSSIAFPMSDSETHNSKVVVISVDGRSGETPEVVTETSRTALVVTGAGENGADGVNALPARPGEPGGLLSVELTPANAAANVMEVRIIRYQAATVLPDNISIPRGRVVQLTARGGNGAPGNMGGDGQDGRPGVDGTDATKLLDATNGGDGGRGGNAGAGSHGGSGRAAGTVEIAIDERHTNLLAAVDWCVDGGKGGPAGKNGNPG
ncbi:hypothetical protein K440DRAFT_663509, partial [Wilcoxina mikolae CBS 423.85]